MSFRINGTVPNFNAPSTEGLVAFHAWSGDRWCVLFSRRKNFSTVRISKLGYMAEIEPESN